MPLHRRLPKRGFTNIFHKDYAILNVGALDKLEGDHFTPESLVASGVVKKLQAGLKILGSGELTRRITVEAHLFSKSALDKIEKAGGVSTVLAAQNGQAQNDHSKTGPAESDSQHSEQ